ncbi:uncharacterized protein LOC121406245 [Lytechinus variegatus]|uniref:uncharacterized protein LOC121406245 n=1 Tax=Lytechinus variegatus TaxID=7654 RepID=UPI001BB15AA9|nr:uncharacterized protein LOC121406245 [Lytechinus variegatus]
MARFRTTNINKKRSVGFWGFGQAAEISRYLVDSRSEGTTNNYFCSFKKFEEFINAEGKRALPAEPIHIALYLTSLIDACKSSTVIQGALYAIKWAHKLKGLADPTTNGFVVHLVEAAKRKSYTKTTKKDILTNEQIVNLCDKYKKIHKTFSF